MTETDHATARASRLTKCHWWQSYNPQTPRLVTTATFEENLLLCQRFKIDFFKFDFGAFGLKRDFPFAGC